MVLLVEYWLDSNALPGQTLPISLTYTVLHSGNTGLSHVLAFANRQTRQATHSASQGEAVATIIGFELGQLFRPLGEYVCADDGLIQTCSISAPERVV